MKRFADLPPELRAAVEAYDKARRDAGGRNEPPMSDANKATIAPMIDAAVSEWIRVTAAGGKI